ncbi:hypothetical protein T11_9328, partial [Trichinella zimbabwensis]
LEAGHQVQDCRESRPCAVVGADELITSCCIQTRRESARSTEPSSVQRGMLAKGNGKGARLQIVRARAYGPDGTHVAVNCLLDTGAQVSFIRKDIAEALGLTGSYEKVRLETVGGSVAPPTTIKKDAASKRWLFPRAVEGSPKARAPRVAARTKTPFRREFGYRAAADSRRLAESLLDVDHVEEEGIFSDEMNVSIDVERSAGPFARTIPWSEHPHAGVGSFFPSKKCLIEI